MRGKTKDETGNNKPKLSGNQLISNDPEIRLRLTSKRQDVRRHSFYNGFGAFDANVAPGTEVVDSGLQEQFLGSSVMAHDMDIESVRSNRIDLEGVSASYSLNTKTRRASDSHIVNLETDIQSVGSGNIEPEETIVVGQIYMRWNNNQYQHKKRMVKNESGVFECVDHGPQTNPTYRYNIKAFIADHSGTAQFTFFTPSSDDVIGLDCYKLVKLLQAPDSHQIPVEVQANKGKKHTFQFHFNPSCIKGSVDFILYDVLDTADTQIQTEKQCTG